MYKFDLEELHSQLSFLPSWKKIVFLIGVSERMLPNYLAFAQKFGLNEYFLRQALDMAWSFLESGKAAGDFLDVAEHCESLAPDTEDFDDFLVSSALDAAVAIGAVFRFISDGEREHISSVVSLVRDSIDMYVQEIDHLDPNDPNLEFKIASHPLMQRELEHQVVDIKYLKLLPDDVLLSFVDLKRRWLSSRESCIGIIWG